MNESQVTAKQIIKAKRLQCRWCDRQFSHGPARASHEKTHKGPARGQYALFDTKKTRDALIEAAAEAERLVQVQSHALFKKMSPFGAN